mgnify:CR=1 FL=1
MISPVSGSKDLTGSSAIVIFTLPSASGSEIVSSFVPPKASRTTATLLRILYSLLVV